MIPSATHNAPFKSYLVAALPPRVQAAQEQAMQWAEMLGHTWEVYKSLGIDTVVRSLILDHGLNASRDFVSPEEAYQLMPALAAKLGMGCDTCVPNCCENGDIVVLLDELAAKQIPGRYVTKDGPPMMAIKVDRVAGGKVESSCAALDYDSGRCIIYDERGILCRAHPIKLDVLTESGNYGRLGYAGLKVKVVPCEGFHGNPGKYPEIEADAARAFMAFPQFIARVNEHYRGTVSEFGQVRRH